MRERKRLAAEAKAKAAREAREKRAQELSKLSEKELMIELILAVEGSKQEVLDAAADIKRTVITYSGD